MTKKYRKNRYLLFVFASWLMAKLRWTLEMSRLAFFRTKKSVEIRFVIQNSYIASRVNWSYDADQLTFLEYDRQRNEIFLHRFPKLNKN